MFQPCKKIDTHLHLLLTPMSREEKKYFSSYDEMVPHLTQLNIEKGIVMSGGETTEFLGSNAQARAISQADPAHYAWMCNLDAVSPETVYDRLKTYKEQGAVGIGEFLINRRLDDPLLRAVFDAAGKLHLPITFHMSPAVGCSYGIVDDPGLPLLEKTLRDFPDTVFVGHSACFWIEISADAPTDTRGRNGYGSTPVVPGGRVVELFERYPNLYGDLSATSGGSAIMRDPAFGLAFLNRFSQRLFFATDMCHTEAYFPLGRWLDEMADAGALNMDAYESICYRNARRVYGI